MNWLKENWFKSSGIILLLIAIGDHPYGYYQFNKWTTTAIAIYLAYQAYESKKIIWAWIFGITALFFNPIIPFYLSKPTWRLLDIVAATIFIFSLFIFRKTNKAI